VQAVSIRGSMSASGEGGSRSSSVEKLCRLVNYYNTSTLSMKPLLVSVALAVIASEAVASEPQYLLRHQEADARFITSIQRVGLCQITTPILERVSVPFQLYPK
jgi:hypothetical protein